MLPVFVLPSAEFDLLAAQDWYDARAAGLGDRFFAAVDVLLARLADNPWQFPVAYKNLRRALVRRFPYALYFRLETEGVFVIACAHTSRDPQQWEVRA
jgi:plasmid stabilization system protein ParE